MKAKQSDQLHLLTSYELQDETQTVIHPAIGTPKGILVAFNKD